MTVAENYHRWLLNFSKREAALFAEIGPARYVAERTLSHNAGAHTAGGRCEACELRAAFPLNQPKPVDSFYRGRESDPRMASAGQRTHSGNQAGAAQNSTTVPNSH